MSNESLSKCPQCGAPLKENVAAGLCPHCLLSLNLKTETAFTGEPVTAQPPLPLDQIALHFPQLEILEYLGRGGMGVVYKARQKSLNRLVALKFLAPERVYDVQFAARFTREAQALAALNHPNIVTIYDFGQAGGYYFLLMEFVDGVNLRQLLHARQLSPKEALAIIPPLCDALQYAHDRGIVHRDIKPENLLLNRDGRVKVADFGIAKMMGVTLQGSPAEEPAQHENTTPDVIGTPAYSAPEQKADPTRVDSRADIYSLGVVFYEMLTGEKPSGNLELPSSKLQIDVRIDRIVLRALEKTPELRYQTAAELRTQVETILSEPAESPATNTKSKKQSKSTALLAPFQSQEVQEISAHLTKPEANRVFLFQIILGVWIISGVWAIASLLVSYRYHGNSLVLGIFASLFIASLALAPRIAKQLLCSTAWAKERGYKPEHLPLFTFSNANLKRSAIYLAFAGLLIFVTHQAITRTRSHNRHAALQVSKQSLEEEKVPRHVRQVNEGPFVAYLPDGGKVELLAVKLNASGTNEPWWQPDGSPSAFGTDIDVERNQGMTQGVLALAKIQWPQPKESPDSANFTLATGIRFAARDSRRIPLSDIGVIYFDQISTSGNEATLYLKVGTRAWQTVKAQKPGFIPYLLGGKGRRQWEFSETPTGNLK